MGEEGQRGSTVKSRESSSRKLRVASLDNSRELNLPEEERRRLSTFMPVYFDSGEYICFYLIGQLPIRVDETYDNPD